MKLEELRSLLKNKAVIDEINKHLWIESQKMGYSIGIERATDEWLRLYAEGWMKFNSPEKYKKLKNKKAAPAKKKIVKKIVKKTVKKAVKKKPAKKKVAKKK